MKKFCLLLFGIAAVAVLFGMNTKNALAASEQEESTLFAKEKETIADVVANNQDLASLNAALKAANLTEVLKGKGPYTVFAPTNDAFAKLPADVLRDLLKPENAEKLSSILKYHVYDGKLTSKALGKLTGKSITMLNADKADICAQDGELFINGAKIITKDIKTKNGIIHIIDSVMLPKKDK